MADQATRQPGQTAYEAYYLAIGGWANGHHWDMISSDEKRAWTAVENACAIASTPVFNRATYPLMGGNERHEFTVLPAPEPHPPDDREGLK